MHELLSRQRDMRRHWQSVTIVSHPRSLSSPNRTNLVFLDSRRAQREGTGNVQASYPPYPPPTNAERTSAEAVVKSRLDGLPMPIPAGRTEQPASQDTVEPLANSNTVNRDLSGNARRESSKIDVIDPQTTHEHAGSAPSVASPQEIQPPLAGPGTPPREER